MGRKPGRKKNPPPLSEKEMKYAQVKALTGSTRKAAEVAGYEDGERTPDNKKGVKFYMEQYKEEMDNLFRENAADVIYQLYYLMRTAKSEQVRLGAMKDWLDRAGLAPVSKSEVEQRKVISTESRVSRELIERLNKMSKKNGEE